MILFYEKLVTCLTFSHKKEKNKNIMLFLEMIHF